MLFVMKYQHEESSSAELSLLAFVRHAASLEAEAYRDNTTQSRHTTSQWEMQGHNLSFLIQLFC